MSEVKTEAPDERRERAKRDNRVIVSGVTLNDGVTYAGDSEDDLDDLEKAMSKTECERLKELGAIAGDWKPGGGDEPEVMDRSRLFGKSPEEQAKIREAATKRGPRMPNKKAAEMTGFGELDKTQARPGREAEPDHPPADSSPHPIVTQPKPTPPVTPPKK